MTLKLEVGAGKKQRAGYLHLDVRALPGLDVRGVTTSLPFKDGSLEEVYSRHVLEHFTLREAVEVLLEWRRVLRPGGSVYIIVPNMLWHFKQVLEGTHESVYTKESGKNARYWGMGSIYGWQQDEYDLHKFGYWPELLGDLLVECGFDSPVDLTNKPESLEKAPWHLEMRAVRGDHVRNPDRFRTLLDVKH
ncbi:MAG: methyltransferase domain-containing protein [Myxococcota bacterium]